MDFTSSIRVDPVSRRESLELITPEFPYQADLCDLHLFPSNSFPWHWHREIEVFYLRSGRLEYHLPGGTTVFEAGQGGFLNSNILHKTTCRPEDACIQEEQQFLPQWIGGEENSRIMRTYVQPILDAPELSLVKLDPAIPAHRPLLELLCRSYALFEQQPPAYELEIQSLLLEFWKGLYLWTRQFQCRPQTPLDDHRIKQMLSYISNHYGERLQLEEIAAAAYLSPRAAGRCFQSQLGTTPFAYLMDFRIQRACELLITTSLSIGEIAAQCGFGSSSYFGRNFREKTGCSPNDYRRQRKQQLLK